MIGEPLFFDVDVYLSACEMLIQSDEVERAFLMLDNMPAFYRDNPPERAIEIRNSLHRQLFTPVQYKGIYKGLEITPADTEKHWPLRARVTEAIVKELNAKGVTPNIMELAGGSLWLPQGLVHKHLQFTYEHLSLDDVEHFFAKPDKPSVNIFCAFELIEHLTNEWEIYQNYLKFNREADIILISTPLYTYAGGMFDWRNNPLGHLRTYTPGELHLILVKMFKGYEWVCHTDDTIVFEGKKSGN